uniref:Sp185/333 n=1 Tax=Strongylocentrotus purpuratus TaxID=7668 RepID=A1DWN1_STRPU|nr:Sp185/333 [Strongylocentrotus purpuratus]
MEVKVTLIVAIVAALAISAHAQRDFNERRKVVTTSSPP